MSVDELDDFETLETQFRAVIIRSISGVWWITPYLLRLCELEGTVTTTHANEGRVGLL